MKTLEELRKDTIVLKNNVNKLFADVALARNKEVESDILADLQAAAHDAIVAYDEAIEIYVKTLNGKL